VVVTSNGRGLTGAVRGAGLGAVAVLCAAALAACDPCHQRCSIESQVLAQCLIEWDLSWEDLGAPDVETHEDICVERFDQRRAGGDAKAIEASCREDRVALEGAADCSAVADWMNGSP
jgi:hypothetical protein